jgi:hypothetical protein
VEQAATASSWSDYRARRWLLRLALASLVGAIWVAEDYAIERHGMRGLLVPLAAWVLLVVAAGIRLQAFRCPRCARRFFRRRPLLAPLRARHCAHCMLPKDP